MEVRSRDSISEQSPSHEENVGCLKEAEYLGWYYMIDSNNFINVGMNNK